MDLEGGPVPGDNVVRALPTNDEILGLSQLGRR